MLPPTLQSLKENLETKVQRSSAESQLLLELKEIDRALTKSDFSESIQQSISKGVRTRLSGPGSCPCCGR